MKALQTGDRRDGWIRGAMRAVVLAAAAAACAATPGLPAEPAPAAARGFSVSNQELIRRVTLSDRPADSSALGPVKLVGIRGGKSAGSVVVRDGKPIKGLKAEAADFKGPGPLAASCVEVRYALPAGELFDALEEVPPAEVPVHKQQGGAIQPIWIAVKVPADAKPGDYAGDVTIRAEGVEPVKVALQLRVVDWRLPPVEKTTVHMDLIQSPESLAMAYEVPMWSEAHLKLLDRTFALLSELSAKTLFISCIRRTHFGNEHAVVRWTMDEEGEVTPDFSIAEKYLDVARKHLGPVPCVVLYVWEPPTSQGHWSGDSGADKAIMLTLVNKETGKEYTQKGPAWGTPECKVFWKKLTDGMQEVLKKRGLENSMTFGLIGDKRPTKVAMDDIGNGVGSPRWAVHSHYYCDAWKGYKMRTAAAIWGIEVGPQPPEKGLAYGWSNPLMLNYFPRETSAGSALWDHRNKVELWMGAGRGSYAPSGALGYGVCGLGRIGVDFWPVMKDGRGRLRGTIAGRYPESAWGQLSLQNTTQHIFGRGKNGPVPTVRSEMYRESVQEVEARIYVEKALLDAESKALLGEELWKQGRALLDERIRIGLQPEQAYIAGWAKRSEALFQLAADVARKFGDKEPKPAAAPAKR